MRMPLIRDHIYFKNNLTYDILTSSFNYTPGRNRRNCSDRSNKLWRGGNLQRKSIVVV